MKALIFILLLGAIGASAQEVSWSKLIFDYQYKDISTHCADSETLYLGVQKKGEEVIFAEIRDYLSGILPRVLTFKPEELVGFGPGQMPLSSRVVNWMLFLFESLVQECQPSQPLATMGPTSVKMVFDGDMSNTAVFTGARKDGAGYEARIRLRTQ